MSSFIHELAYQRLTHLLRGMDEAAAEYAAVIDRMVASALVGERERRILLRQAERKALARLKAEQPGPGLDDDQPVPFAVHDRPYRFVHRVPVEHGGGSW